MCLQNRLVIQFDAAFKMVANKIGHVVPVLLMYPYWRLPIMTQKKVNFFILFFFGAVQYAIYRKRDRVFNSTMSKDNE